MIIKKLLKQKKRSERLKVLIASTVAMGVGISVGFLVAPKSGKEMREDISNKLEKAANTLKGAAAEVKELITNMEEQMENNIKDAAEEVKDNLDETMDGATQYAEETKNKLKSKIVNVAEAVEEKWGK